MKRSITLFRTTMTTTSFRGMMAVLAIALLSIVSATAQTINVYGVNTSAFPRITADYQALDGMGQPITNLTAADFGVVETPQGGSPVDLTSTIGHGCVDKTTDPEASIIIILDRSKSMGDPVPGIGRERWEFAKDAVRAFVNRIRFVGQTRVSLVTFSGTYQVVNEWVDNAQPILDSLNNLKWQTTTNYTLAFETPMSNIYELFKKRPANIPKYAFFLTDGHPNPAIADEPKFVSENSQKLVAQGIRFFSVTILETFTHWTLESLARATGGKSIVTNEQGVADIFGLLALETQVTKLCQLTWISPYSCSEQAQSRTATITLKRGSNPTTRVSYLAPPSSVARVDVSDPVLFCGDPLPNNAQTALVTITAVNAMFMATAANIVPSTYFRVLDWNHPNNQQNFSPFNLAPGAKRTFRIEFKQGDTRSFRQALMSFTGSPCPPSITLVGGTGLILLQSPIGGELYSTCDTVTIKWAGVLPTQDVTIDYSENGGTTWTNITTTARGLSHRWLPPRAGVNYRVRVGVSPAPQYVWLKGLGGTGADTVTSVAVHPNGSKVYVTGVFDGPTRIGTQTSNNLPGGIDAFLAILDSDGNVSSGIFLTGNTASDEDRLIGVVTDKQGNYYVAGHTTSQSLFFGPFQLSGFGATDTRNMFVFKFDPTGQLVWQNMSKGTGTQSSWANATDIGVEYDAGGNFVSVIVAGQFERYISVGNNAAGQNQFSGPYTGPGANTRRNYYVRYDGNGYATLYPNAVKPTNPQITYKGVTARDDFGFAYEAGTFVGNKNVSPPPIVITSNGQSDVFVSKNGATPASADASDSDFSVQAPQLGISSNREVFPPTPQANTSSKTVTLRNTGSFPVTIQRINMTGANPGDFSLLSQIIGRRLNPGDAQTIEILFTPQGIGARAAILEILGNCNAQVQIVLEGTGLARCEIESDSDVDLGKVPLGQPTSRTITCVLKNTGPLPVNGTMRITQTSTDITVRNLGPISIAANGGCLNVDVDIAAATPGMHSVVLAFDLPSECGTPTSTIYVEVVEPRVAIDSVDLGRLRVLTSALDTITITNLNPDPATITALSLSGTNPNFAITLPPPPITLPPGGKVFIPVTFTPQARGAHSVLVRATVLGQSAPLEGEAKGFGFLPAIEATGYTFNAWTIGSTSAETGKVIIRNTDTESSLRIERADFATATTSFAWIAPQPTFPATIPPGGTLEMPVSFTPQQVGVNTINVCITHDAMPGPGPIPPYRDTCVVVSGIGIDQSDIPPVVFPRTLICATRVDSFEIRNPSPLFDLRVNAPTATGDVASFSLDQTTDFVIPAGGSRVIRVTFQPSTTGPLSATYSFGNDQALRLNVTVSGVGGTTPVSFTFGQIPAGAAGDNVQVPIDLGFNAAEVGGVVPTEYRLRLTFDPQALTFNTLSGPQPTGWTFTPTVTPGQLEILAQSNGSAMTSGDFITVVFGVFLNADSVVDVNMTATTDLICLIPSGSAAGVTMKEVCYTEGRLVTLGTTNFGLAAPLGNPVRDELTVPYSTGIRLATTFQVVDALGNVVHESQTPVVPSGSYTFRMNTLDLASGTYVLRMVSGPYTNSVTFVIVR